MPNCTLCGRPIDCPNHGHQLGGARQPCPLTRGALWVQVLDERGAGVLDVKVSSGGDARLTDDLGFASFDPVAASQHSVEVDATMPPTHSKTHAAPQVPTADATVNEGEIALVRFTLHRLRPRLEVVANLDFAPVEVGTPVNSTVVLKNVGDGELVLGEIRFQGPFAATGPSLAGRVVAPGDTVALEIACTPKARGDQRGYLTITSNDQASPSSVTLRGVGLQALLEVVDSLDFGDVVLTTTLAKKLTVKNIGDADLVFANFAYSGPFAASVNNALGPNDRLGPGASAELELLFTPNVDGALTGALDITSNAPAPAHVVLRGRGLLPWKLSIAVTSTKRGVIGAAAAAWPAGDVEVGVSDAADTHDAPAWSDTQQLGDPDGGSFQRPDVLTGTAPRTVYVWARSADGAWSSLQDVQIQLTPGADATAAIHMEPLTATIELFRGATILRQIPFSTTEVDATLDAALPDNEQGIAAPGPSGQRQPFFTFPDATNYADVVEANADLGLFRVRLKFNYAPHVPPPADLKATLKVLTAQGDPVSDVRFGNGPIRASTASHPAGMSLTLKQSGDCWESPYMRIATTDVRSACALVHSLGPLDKAMQYPADPNAPDDCEAIMAAGRQFGRKLQIEATALGVPVHVEHTLGGRPHARVPVKFWMLSSNALEPTPKQRRIARAKIHNLNAYWAGQGIEFALVDVTAPIERAPAPPRRLITINEHTGAATVSNAQFDVLLDVAATVAGIRTVETVTITVPGGESPAQVAAAIVAGLQAWTPAAPALAGLKLDAETFDLNEPRAYLSAVAFNNAQALPLLGACGPVDVVLKPGQANALNLDALELAGLRVDPPDQGIDLNAPPMARPYHDAVFNPPAATTRQWARTFGGGTHGCVSVVVESTGHDHYKNETGYPRTLCEQGFSTLVDANEVIHDVMAGELGIAADMIAESKSAAVTLLRFGHWNEACADFTFFVAAAQFSPGADDVQHEMGHALADLDHTLVEPAWFYDGELLRTGSASPKAKWKISRHEVFVSCLALNGQTWEFCYKALPNGYGGAARDRIAQLQPGWVVDANFNGWT